MGDCADTVALGSDRHLGYARFGAADGEPVLYLHGIPGSRLELQPLADSVRAAGVQVVALDRPGYGLSSPPRAGAQLRDFADDAGRAMSALGIDRFHVVGFSGGGPHALACAAQLGARVRGVLTAGALAPVTTAERRRGMNALVAETYRVAREEPDRLHEVLTPLAEDVPALVEQLVAVMAAEDRAWLDAARLHAVFADNIAEGLRNGADGVVHDVRRLARDWDFAADAVHQPVTIFHGLADGSVPPTHAEHLAAVLPRTHLWLEAGCAHYALFEPERLCAALTELFRGGVPDLMSRSG